MMAPGAAALIVLTPDQEALEAWQASFEHWHWWFSFWGETVRWMQWKQ